MKLKIILISCLFSFFFLGCNSKERNELKSKNDLLVKENNDLKNQVYELTESRKKLEKENNKLNLQTEPNNQYSSTENENIPNMNIFLESILNDFHYEFPDLLNLCNVEKKSYNVSEFTEEEKKFYEKNVGCYLPENILTKEYISSHLSEFTIKYVENDIIFWGFYKNERGIHYDIKDKLFYDYDTFSTNPITDLSEYENFYDISKYRKYTNFDIITEVINDKKHKMNRKSLSKIEENKLRIFLIEFNILLEQYKFNEIMDVYFNPNMDRNEYTNMFFWNHQYQDDSFDIYINTFFNDDISKYDEDIIFIELMYSYPMEYVNLAVKEVEGKYKISNYSVRYDEE